MLLTPCFYQTKVTKNEQFFHLFVYHSFLLFFAPKNLIFQWKDRLWTKTKNTMNATKREQLDRFNNDSFEWAILNFSPKNPTKKFKKFSHFNPEKLHSTRPSRYIVVVYVNQSLARRCSHRFCCSRSEVVHSSNIYILLSFV